LPDERLIALIF